MHQLHAGSVRQVVTQVRAARDPGQGLGERLEAGDDLVHRRRVVVLDRLCHGDHVGQFGELEL
jgi:hypothetical protein